MASPEICKMLVMSTAHLPAEVFQDFEHCLVMHGTAYGGLLWVPAEDEQEHQTPDEDMSDEGVAAIAGVIAFARAHDCAYILFDRDAGVVAGLPTWEH